MARVVILGAGGHAKSLRHVLSGGKLAGYEYSRMDMEKHGHHCSSTERRADEASWDVNEALKCEYLRDHVEDEFDGVVSGVSSFGLFIDIADFGITGLIHVTALGHDYFHHDPVHHRLTGEHSGIVYRIGEQIRIKVVQVNVDDRKIDLEPLALPEQLQVRPPRKKGHQGRRRGRRK